MVQKMKITFSTLIFVAVVSYFEQRGYAHGEDKPGPNGGHIRMPGAFHTEVVPGTNSVRVYLLDLTLKNSTVDKSSVSILLNGTSVPCKPKELVFVCDLPKGINTASGKLVVKAKYQDKAEGSATYMLPLAFKP